MDQDTPAGSTDQSQLNAAARSVPVPVGSEFGTSVGQVVRSLRRLGGVASRSQLLAELDDAPRVAHALSGVLCLASAALHHGWAVKSVPERPQVWVARNRRTTPSQRTMADIHRQRLYPDDISGRVTSKAATLRDCLRQLPEDEALAVADSALRAGEFAALREVVMTVQGSGAARVRRIAGHASADAANPFESVLRCIALRVPGLTVKAQHWITDAEPWVRVDLADVDRRIVMEADSFEWHGKRDGLRSDCRRYDELVSMGWIVLRFAWEDVMFDQDWIESVLRRVVALSDRRTEVVSLPRLAA